MYTYYYNEETKELTIYENDRVLATISDVEKNRQEECLKKSFTTSEEQIYKEVLYENLQRRKFKQFEFWSGAVTNAKEFTLEELDRIGEELETADNGDGYDETQINDLMWFEPEYLASLIGLEWDSETGKVIR